MTAWNARTTGHMANSSNSSVMLENWTRPCSTEYEFHLNSIWNLRDPFLSLSWPSEVFGQNVLPRYLGHLLKFSLNSRNIDMLVAWHAIDTWRSESEWMVQSWNVVNSESIVPHWSSVNGWLSCWASLTSKITTQSTCIHCLLLRASSLAFIQSKRHGHFRGGDHIHRCSELVWRLRTHGPKNRAGQAFCLKVFEKEPVRRCVLKQRWTRKPLDHVDKANTCCYQNGCKCRQSMLRLALLLITLAGTDCYIKCSAIWMLEMHEFHIAFFQWWNDMQKKANSTQQLCKGLVKVWTMLKLVRP